jgi:hypothetical protein
MGRGCSSYGGEDEFISDFGGEPEGKRPLGRQRRSRLNNIKMDLREIA